MSSEASRYTAEINFRHINNSQVLAIGRVPAKSRVLDLGAADGSVAAALQRLGCRIWAVELDPVAAEAAKRFCQDVAVEDLNQLDLAERFGGQRFDVVLMLDILEHLTEPAAVLRRVTSILADGGWGIISLPNIAHLSVRLSLLEGKFTYTDLGLLDRTHLRFFNRAGVDELLQEAGWGMFELVRSTREFGTTEINVEGADPELVHRLESDIEARTYQFVIGAAPLGSKALKHPPVIPGALAQTVSLELEEELRSLHQTVIPELEAQSGSLRSELGSLQAELASRQASWRLVRPSWCRSSPSWARSRPR